jgi:cysteine-S-conjugate beta-lyase
MKFDFDTVIDRRNTNSAKWDLVKELFGNEDVLPMWVADMDFNTAPCIVEALKKQAERGIFGYVRRPQSCSDAIVDWVRRRHGWQIRSEWLTYSPGVVTALNLCIQAFTQPGDRIIIQPPVYYPFARSIISNGRRVENNPLQQEDLRYRMDLEALEKKSAERTPLMILCSPHNPVGRVWEKEELARAGEFCVKNDIILVSDEVHCDLAYRGHKHTPTAAVSDEIAQRTITCMAPSKTFNLAGLKTSIIIIPNPKIREKYNVILQNLALGADNAFGLAALEAAYRHGEEWLEALLDYLEANMAFAARYFAEKIPKIKVVEPDGTYLLWLDCRGLGLDSQALDAFMRKTAKIWLDDGPLFGPGGEGFQRMNIACPRSTLVRALGRIEEAIKLL